MNYLILKCLMSQYLIMNKNIFEQEFEKLKIDIAIDTDKLKL